MEFKQLFADDDAVSPVIGVILMVAITVILAAVIGTFVLGLGDQVSNTSPTASFTFDFEDSPDGSDGDVLSITHDGGSTVAASQLTVKTSGTAVDLADATANIGTGGNSPEYTTSEPLLDGTNSFSSGADVTAGTTFYIGTDGDTAELNSDTVRVTWQASSGGKTATLGKWSGPNA